MFILGFTKVAVPVSAQISPEEYYELVHEKDPYIGSLLGGAKGAAIGAYKGTKGKKDRAALIGAGTGAITGALTGSLTGKALKHYQSNKIRRLASDLHLRATPTRSTPHHEE